MCARKRLGMTPLVMRLLGGALAISVGAFALGVADVWHFGTLDQKRPSDVVIVLGAESHDGEVSEVFAERLNHAAWLYREGYVRKVIVCGGVGEDSTTSEAADGKAYLVAAGVDAGDVLCEDRSRYTRENLANARAIMEDEGLRTAIVVSDPMHMRRALTIAHLLDMDAVSSPTPTTRYRTLRYKVPFAVREVLWLVEDVIRMQFWP